MRASRVVWVVLVAAALGFAADEKDELLRQADAAVYDGKVNQARALYERALKAGADLSGDYTRAQNLGLVYLNGTPPDFAKAAQWLGVAIQLRPGSDETRLYYAQALAWGKRYEQAIQQYKTLWEAHPEVSDYALGLANVHYWAGKPEAAFAVFQRFLEAQPSNVAMRLEYARVLGFAKRYTDALGQYQVVLNGDPNNLAAQVGIAKITSWQNDLPGALERYNRILKRQPDLYEAQVGKGFTLLWMGRTEEARKILEAALRRFPGDREVATALRQMGPAKPKEPAVAAKKEEPKQPEPPAVVAAQPAEPPAAPPPPPEDPVVVLTRQAEAASARGEYAAAVHHYHEVLKLQPDNRPVMLQIARVLSWDKSYGDAAAQYQKFLDLEPKNVTARQERARVLSWAQQFDASLAEYQRVVQEMEASNADPGVLREARLEYARVLSWSRRYDESLAQLDQLIPAQPQASDYDALLVKARVLAWSQRYDQSIATYDQILGLRPADLEARVGKAQTVYYSGRLGDSRVLLRQVLTDHPRHPDASLTLASVENGLGNRGRALRLLADAPANDDTRNLRRLIRRDMRPVLRLRFGFENDIEAPSAVPNTTTIRGLRYSAAIEFNLLPDVRMEVSNVVTDTDTSSSVLGQFGRDALATETMARLMFRATPWLYLTLGVGGGTTGRGEAVPGVQASRRQHVLYDFHPVITHRNLRVDFAATRHVADYTPLAVHDNVVHRRESLSVSNTWRQRVRGGVEYWHASYSVETPSLLSAGTSANGGALYVIPTLYRNDRVTLDGGMRFEMYGFADSAEALTTPPIGSAGFFTPRVYQRYMGTGRLSWMPDPKVQIDLNGTFGPQRIFTFAGTPRPEWGATGSVGSQVTFRLGRVSPYVAYDFFSTATAASPGLTNGSYRSHAFVVGLNHRF